MNAYTWDESGLEVHEFDVSELSPIIGKVSPVRLALLADTLVAADLEEVDAEQNNKGVTYGCMRLYDISVEQEADTTILTGKFGRDMACCLVINPNDDGMAQHVARRRLHLYEEKDNAEG